MALIIPKMFWDKKDKKEERGLPDLPTHPQAAPSMRDFQHIPEEEHEEIHSLPSFPDSPMKKGFSQTAIKDAVETEDIKEDYSALPDLPELPEEEEEEEHERQMPQPPKKSRIVEMEEWKPSNEFKPLPVDKGMPKSQLVRNPLSKKPIFVKLDKFQTARVSLETVKEKLNDMDELLKMIREVKAKEDEEIGAWEKEIEQVKSRVETIRKDIFENYLEGN